MIDEHDVQKWKLDALHTLGGAICSKGLWNDQWVVQGSSTCVVTNLKDSIA